MNIWLAIFLGGGIGSMVRHAMSRLFLAIDLRGTFPYATLASNLLATTLLAWMMLRMQDVLQGRESWKALLAVGFCGGFSTFSTFSYENFLLLREGQFGLAMLNAVVSIGACLLVFHLIARS